MKLFDMIKVFHQTKRVKYKRESNYYDLINSNEIQLYKIGMKEIVECNAFEMSKCKASQCDIRYQNV